MSSGIDLEQLIQHGDGFLGSMQCIQSNHLVDQGSQIEWVFGEIQVELFESPQEDLFGTFGPRSCHRIATLGQQVAVGLVDRRLVGRKFESLQHRAVSSFEVTRLPVSDRQHILCSAESGVLCEQRFRPVRSECPSPAPCSKSFNSSSLGESSLAFSIAMP